MKARFLVDNALREAVVNSCISLLLKSAGIDSKLDNYNFLYSESGYDFLERTKEKTDVLLLPSYNVKRTPEQLSRAIRTNSRMVATHAEQIINPALYEEKLNTKSKSSYNRHIVSHFVWGSFFSKLLTKYANVPADKIYITGNPKLQVSTRFGNSNENSSKKTVLIVSDFSLGDMDEEKWSKFKRDYHVDYKNPINKHYSIARKELIAWIREACYKFQDVEFRMRIHPGEEKSAYNGLNDIKNVSIVGERDFIEDVIDSNLIFSYSSTSLFEVLVMNKQVYNLNLYELPEERKGEYFELFEWINKDEFIEKIKNVSEGVNFQPSPKRIKLLQKYMYGGNENALLRSAIAIKDVIENRGYKYNLNDYLSHFQNLILASVKDKFVKTGVWIESEVGLSNYVSSFARKRQDEDLNNPVRLNNSKIESSLKSASRIITNDDINIIKNNLYEIRRTDEGIYIDF